MKTIRLTLFISLITFLNINVIFGQDYLLQTYTNGGKDEIYAQRSMAVSKDGNIYATGLFNGTYYLQGDSVVGGGIYLAKFTNDLSLIWLKKVAGRTGGGSLSGLKLMIALDSSDNSIIGFSTLGGSGVLIYDDSVDVQTNNVELIKLDSSGTRLWRTAVTGSNRMGDKGVAVDGQNNILIIGKNVNDDIFITKYSESGNEIWYKTAGVLGAGKTDIGTVITTDNDNNIYATGMLNNNEYTNIGGSDTAYFDSHEVVFPVPCFSASYLTKYSSDGSLNWVRYVYSSSPTQNNAYGSSTITAIECFKNGTIAIGGYFTNQLLEFSDGFSSVNKQGNIGFRSSFLASFDSDGNRLWAKTLHNTTGGGTNIVDMDIDSTSSIYLLNEYWGTIVTELGDTNTVNNNTSFDLLLERYTTNGQLQSSMTIGGGSSDFAYDIVKHGNSIFTYSTIGGNTCYVGADSISFSNSYGTNMLILKLIKNPTLGINDNLPTEKLTVFPNPNNGIFTVQMPTETSAEITVYTISGKVIYNAKMIQNPIEIDLHNVPSGVYFLQLHTEKYNGVSKILKN